MSTPTDGAQLSAASAFWGLVGLALNVIIQPTGRVCGFHPSVRAQVRSSPIVCVADSICIVTRLLFNIFYYKLSFKKACRLTLHRKKVGWKGEPQQDQGNSDSQSPMQTEGSGGGTHPGEIDIEMGELQNEQGHSDSGSPTQVEVEGFGDSTSPVEVGPEATGEALGLGNVTGNMQQEPSGDSLTFEGPSAARVLSFTLTGFPQWLKIIVCSGAPWTSTWASFYFWPFLITEVINITAGRIDTEEDRLDRIRIDRINSKWEVRLDFYERALGVFAVFMQLIVFLALERYPPNRDLDPIWAGISSVAYIPWRATTYFSAYHIFSIPQSPLDTWDGRHSRSNPNMISTLDTIIGGAIGISFVIIVIAFTAFHFYSITAYNAKKNDFVLLYIPQAINFYAWPLYIPMVYILFFILPKKMYLSLCKGPRGNGGGSELTQRRAESRSARAFVFAASIIYFGAYYYWLTYNPGDTRKPGWSEYLG